MPVIRLSDALFLDIKSIADWRGIDTPSKVIEDLVRKELQVLDMESNAIEEEKSDERSTESVFFKETPGLTHTKILSARIFGKEIKSPKWNTILIAVIKYAKDKGLSKEMLSINSESGKFEDSGYTFYPELGFSVQGQSAPDAWKEAERLANKYSIPVEIEFKWREKNGAQHPGQTGILKAGNA